MTQPDWSKVEPTEVLDFWFPENGHWNDVDTHIAFWEWRMAGQAHGEIIGRFADLATAAAEGRLDHWAQTPRGRLALVIALDQFSRSVWQGTPMAYAQDIKATRLVMAAFENGDYDALPNVWEKQFMLIAVSHCEGPDHLQRAEILIEKGQQLAELSPDHLRAAYQDAARRPKMLEWVIGQFGRHPHRNAELGRLSTPAEQAYLAKGCLPHQNSVDDFCRVHDISLG